jgi:hypothetical protein
LSTFGAKKNLAFALGLVDRDERNRLQAIATIRNVFAHHLLDATFIHRDVAKAFDQLTAITNRGDSPRKRFVTAVTKMTNDLRMRTLDPRTPDEFTREVEGRVRAEWEAAMKRRKERSKRQ